MFEEIIGVLVTIALIIFGVVLTSDKSRKRK